MIAVKRIISVFLLSVAGGAPLLNAASIEPWSLETSSEWFVTGDFNGDGLPDIVIVDRALGHYRVGWQKEPDNVVWSEGQPSGMTRIEGMAVGRILDVSHDSLAFAASTANRVNLLTPDADDMVVPLAVFTKGFGPNQLVAMDIGGIENTGHDDLVVATRFNNLPAPGWLESIRSTGGVFQLIDIDDFSETRFSQSHRAQLRENDPSVFLTLHQDEGTYGLSALDYRSGAPANAIPGLGELSAQTRMVVGRFAERPLATLIFHEPGTQIATVWGLSENGPVEFVSNNLFELSFPGPIGTLALLPDPSGNRLLYLAADGSQAIVYAFNEEPDPKILETFTPDGTDPLTGVLPLGDGHFMTLSGVNGRSTQFQTWLQNGDSYEAGPSGSLPQIDSNAGRATILEFRGEPLVAAQPGMTRSVAVGDWSAGATLVGAPLELASTIEQFAGVTSGLDNPVAKTIGPAHPESAFTLPSQYQPEISFFQLFDARGDEVATLVVDPAGGNYSQAVHATLSSVPDSVVIVYRVGENGNWQGYNGTPITLFTNTVLQFFAVDGASARSRIQTETYSFTQGPDDLDSDGDGVPDYVEVAQGLDPIDSGNDGDGDGFFDRDELLEGTDPRDPGDSPVAGHPRLEDLNWIDLLVTPEPYDGSQLARTTSAVGTSVRAFDSAGSLLGEGTTFNIGLSGVPDPAAQLKLNVQPELPWFTATTESHFELVTIDPDRNRGRELQRVILMPENDSSPAVSYVFDPTESLAVNADAWIDEVRGLYAARERLVLDRTLREDDVLIGLLLEKHLAQTFIDRGDEWATNFTLFPQRSADVGRRAPTLSQLQSLEHRVSPTLPAYRLAAMLDHFESVVKSGVGANLDQLRLLTRDIYRASSALHNDAPGSYVSPIAVIRDFIATGNLEANYAAQSTLSPANHIDAFTAVMDLLNGVPERPHQTLQLVVRPDSFSGECTLMDTPIGPTTWGLVHANGEAYGALESFDLVPGTRLQVSGYTDITSAVCGPNGIEVESISLQLVPAASTYDLDGNLLIDSWEQVFFGGSVDPFDDNDLDLFSNLQEMLEGSDPNDSLGQPGVAVAALGPPILQISVLPNDDVRLSWDWPFAYATQIQVQMLSKPTLSDSFDLTPLVPIHLGGDQFEVVIASPGGDAYFFQFALSLDTN